MKRYVFLLLSLLVTADVYSQTLGAGTGKSSIVLPDLLEGSVVLQQQTNARIWGKAAPGAPVVVTTSWNDASYSTVAASDSLWSVKVATPEAGFTPYDITIRSGNDRRVMSDVLIGDVWLCGGQSNMQMPLQGMISCYVEGAAEAITTSGRYDGLRYVTVAQNKLKESDPSYFPSGSWHRSSPATAASFSAVGFFFGSTLNETLNVPIGLISCNYSGSFIEDWFDSALLERYPDQKVFGAEFTKAFTQLWYGMMEPVTNYTIKGMIWYQGESNVGSPDYEYRLASAVDMWKHKFELETMPFYIVELAPYQYNNGYDGRSPYFREQQLKASQIIPDAGFVSTSDLAYDYERQMIHPAQKKAVGQRLAAVALNKAYKMGNPCAGPEYDEMEVTEGGIVLTFRNAGNGFRNTGPIRGFEIAGEDGVFYPAQAVPTFKRPAGGVGRGFGFGIVALRIFSDQVTTPVAVRYCFKDFAIGSFYNTEGFPMVPFRTDNWNN